MESHYPLSCQEDWDHCGLQAGNIHTEVNKIMIGLDADLQTLQEAIDARMSDVDYPSSILIQRIDFRYNNTDRTFY